MIFSSLMFIFLFLPVVTIGYFILSKNNTMKNLWLFIFSIGFYFLGGAIEHTKLLLGCILFNYLMALSIEWTKIRSSLWSKIVLIITILGDLMVLGYYKYGSFVISQIAEVWGKDNMVYAIALPIGISFYIFQALSYVVDVYRGEKAEKNPINVGLYICFFPQLVAGPIVRFREVSRDLHIRKETINDFSEGLLRFVVGFNKKILLANTLGELADLTFLSSEKSVFMAWLGALAYALQIFYDFSGYSDMAIGLGRMFGFHFGENFNYPYAAKSITEFWRRWHISLSAFFRDYVYIPLGGGRVNASKHIMNLAIVWIATGMWHGANWTFLVWGIGYFILIIFEKYVFKPYTYKNNFLVLLYRVFTLVSIILLWVVFRAESLKIAISYIMIMFGNGAKCVLDAAVLYQIKNYWVFILIGIMGSVPFGKSKIIKRILEKKVVCVAKLVMILVLFAVAVSRLMIGSYNPFIYFMF